MITPLTPAAPRKAPLAKSKTTDPAIQEQQDALAQQQAIFDVEAAEQAEFERERNAMDTLMTQYLKDEDAIMKKWIEMA